MAMRWRLEISKRGVWVSKKAFRDRYLQEEMKLYAASRGSARRPARNLRSRPRFTEALICISINGVAVMATATFLDAGNSPANAATPVPHAETAATATSE